MAARDHQPTTPEARGRVEWAGSPSATSSPGSAGRLVDAKAVSAAGRPALRASAPMQSESTMPSDCGEK
jgi:hypothetical protein